MLGAHDRAILQFSGGKDSLALLLLARPYLDRIQVCFVDSGAVVPHVLDFIDEVCDRLQIRLTRIRPPVDVLVATERDGLPSDMVPAWRAPDAAWINKQAPGQKIQSPVTCCKTTLWDPMYAHVQRSGIKLVLRGVKRVDAHRGVGPGTVDEHGIEYAAPIWDWDNDRVMAYIAEQGFEPAEQYPEVVDSMDCWSCTGYTTAHYGPAKLRYMRQHYPGLWSALKDRLRRVRTAIAEDQAMVDAAVNPVLED